MSKAHKSRSKNKWYVENIYTNISMTINNGTRFCKENGLTPSGMRQTANGKRKTHKGWICKKVEENFRYPSI